MRKKLFVLVICLIGLNLIICKAETPPDSCLKFYWEPQDSTFRNVDSVMVDSCEQSQTFGQLYAKEYFVVEFDHNIIPRDTIYPKDTIIEYSWEDIDTNYSELRLGFFRLYQKYGNFWFREIRPQEVDTTVFFKRELFIRFEDYRNIDSIVDFIKEIPLVSEVLYFQRYGGVVDVEAEKNTNENDFSMFPIPAKEIIYFRFDSVNRPEVDYPILIEIYSISGVKVYSKYMYHNELCSINLKNFNGGLYFVRHNNTVKPLLIIK
ncbi:MAG: hypothetical protein GXO79_07805 [Chlorobi bacterium]|nr:hypothetical protein [Chlorobiota bacterium]